jgi:hypothetical protein
MNMDIWNPDHMDRIWQNGTDSFKSQLQGASGCAKHKTMKRRFQDIHEAGPTPEDETACDDSTALTDATPAPAAAAEPAAAAAPAAAKAEDQGAAHEDEPAAAAAAAPHCPAGKGKQRAAGRA